ncbi:Na+/H+ antiporter [Asticcacaulis taihuensis]|uniref:Monovalent cation:H+ antiporter, CPA1 family n=2 Tax=Asticcacaulis taihuensis TaxID=260084 RepID=A0A1G4TBT4_9CAUL|nr:Na+/H+ antiporter [Asticcacaulis taihuensis]SCW78826.1 monovalent cation:H+ antiporter, CPA1 family [Asticcacaulis taihuensis]
MESVAISLFLLLAVVVSGWLSRLSPLSIPTPVVQIALGAVIALSTGAAVDLEPDVFFLLFLPPLLFYDGWKIPKEGLFRDKGTILQLALGLVVFTVVGLGLFIHWMIPLMPLGAAFALAAILSPTDPIAVSAISTKVPIPKRLMHILEGESLLNDASGLVCMRFAVAAVVTGSFSLVDAFGAFLWLAIGGLAIGIGVTWVVTRVKGLISRRIGEEAGSQVLISLLIPFGAYLLAERLHCSGILAAVAAGITMSYAEQSGQALADTRVRRNAVWDMIQFTANGIIFVLLGEQLPSIASRAAHVVQSTGHTDPLWLIVYVAAISLALIVLRFLWVWVALRFTLFRAVRKGLPVQRPSLRLIAATSLAGVRGAITLAGVLTIPFFVADGSAFPSRNLIIFLAASVIVVSLLLASIGLPFLLKNLKLPPEPKALAEEDNARAAAAEAAIEAIEQLQKAKKVGRNETELYGEAAARVMEVYRRRIEKQGLQGEAVSHLRKLEEIERQLRLAGIRAERDVYYERSRSRELSDEISRRLIREADLAEARLTGS